MGSGQGPGPAPGGPRKPLQEIQVARTPPRRSRAGSQPEVSMLPPRRLRGGIRPFSHLPRIHVVNKTHEGRWGSGKHSKMVGAAGSCRPAVMRRGLGNPGLGETLDLFNVLEQRDHNARRGPTGLGGGERWLGQCSTTIKLFGVFPEDGGHPC